MDVATATGWMDVDQVDLDQLVVVVVVESMLTDVPTGERAGMNAPPMEVPPQQGMKNKGGGGGGGGRPPSGGGRREPNLFDKVSNFVADSGTIAVLKVSC